MTLRGPHRYDYRGYDRSAAVNSQSALNTLALTQSQATLPPGQPLLPDRFYRPDRRHLTFMLVARPTATAGTPVGASYMPERFTPKSKITAWDTQQPTSSQAPLPRPPIPPPGGGGGGGGGHGHGGGGHHRQVAVMHAAQWVAVTSQSNLHGFDVLSIGAVPSSVQPPGQRYFPDRIYTFSSAVAVNSQRYLWWFPLSQSGQVFWTGSGGFNATGVVSNRAVAAWTGKTTLSAVAINPNLSVAAFTGRGVWTATGVAVRPAIFTMAGATTLSWKSVVSTQSVATWGGFGVFRGAAFTTRSAVDSWTGGGAFQAEGAFSNNLPFNYPPSWSIMLYAPIIEGAAYDPTTKNLKVWFTNTGGQFIILQNLPISVTNAIDNAANPEAYVLSLIKNATH